MNSASRPSSSINAGYSPPIQRAVTDWGLRLTALVPIIGSGVRVMAVNHHRPSGGMRPSTKGSDGDGAARQETRNRAARSA